MRFDFNEVEKGILGDFSKSIDKIPQDLSILKDKNKCMEVLNFLCKTIYFNEDKYLSKDINYGSLLFKMRTMLCNRNFMIYFISEMGIRLIREIIHRLNIKDISYLVEDLISQNKIISPAYIEDNVNINIEAIKSEGILQRDGYVLNGLKRCVPFLEIADFIMVLSRIQDRLYFFIVDKKNIKVVNNRSLYGIDWFNIAEIEIDKKIVSKDYVIGPIDERYFFIINDILISWAIGLMEISFKEATTFAKSHKNMDRPIIAYQEVGFKLAEMKTLLDASYLIAAKSMSFKKNTKEALEMNLIAKIFCLESLEYIASSSLSILSSHGISDDYMSKDILVLSKFLQINGISTEVSRVNLGDMELGYKKFH